MVTFGWLTATKLGTNMIVDKKKKIQGGKIKLIFKNLIFPQRDFVWWHLKCAWLS